ncbi:MAG: glycine/betaine ABC transporter substrate-binding protein [Erysipelothrix sp.]|nr:glycine/betaine ABC transporter substrate-binding protein [Erysipelothrix sp.]
MKKLLSLLLVVILLSGCSSGETIVIASKQFTENIIMSEVYAQLIEEMTDLKVERKQNLGGTTVIFQGYQEGEVDLYFEYTGTIVNEILEEELPATSDEVEELARTGMAEEYGMTFFNPVGLNNTFALAVLKSVSDEYGITTMSDLAEHDSEFRFGANHLFFTRVKDGFDGMSELYGYEFDEVLRMDTSLAYEAIANNQLDVIVVYATDSLLRKYDMVVLEDDLDLFPAYHGAPLVRTELLEEHPELNDIFNLLAGKIDDAMMQEINYQVDVENRSVKDVASELIEDLGLLD